MSLFDLSGAVLGFAVETVTLSRPAYTGFGPDGLALPRTVTTLAARASVQPITPAALNLLPQGTDVSKTVELWVTLLVLPDDTVTLASGTYRILQVRDWMANGKYTHAIAVRLGVGET